MTQLELKIESRDGVVLMAFSGELDLAEAARVEQRLLEIEAARPPLVVLDLRGLTFIDSSGLRLGSTRRVGRGQRPHLPGA